jgi:hypothetical protein
MTNFRLTLRQLDIQESALFGDDSHVPADRPNDRRKSPFEILGCADRDGITARRYLLMVRSLNGTLAAWFRRVR